MRPRQTVPKQWLIADERLGDALWPALRKLPLGGGVLLLRKLERAERRRLRQLVSLRRLMVLDDSSAPRVHNIRELRTALMKRPRLILISPIHETRSHPDWQPLPRMRAATLARLAGREAMALGGMDARRYAKTAPLGFIGWAGIDAVRT
jgi:thiamine-phosphate pyrophosphorylase